MSSSTDKDEGEWIVKFVPFRSSVESSFWVDYCQKKLDTIRLSEDPIEIDSAHFDVCSDNNNMMLQVLQQKQQQSSSIAMKGTLLGFNTVESFQSCNKNQLLQQAMVSVQEGQDKEKQQEKLVDFKLLLELRFLLLTYADLKNHSVLTWFAFPAVATKPGKSIRALGPAQPFSKQDTIDGDSFMNTFRQFYTSQTDPSFPVYFLYYQGKCHHLQDYDAVIGQQQEQSHESITFAFLDPLRSKTTIENPYMGWPMRNLVAYLSLQLNLGGNVVSILSFRPSLQSIRDLNAPSSQSQEHESLLLKIRVPTRQEYLGQNASDGAVDSSQLSVVGWEINLRTKKPSPRLVNLKPLLDETHLAIQAADLNLKLMKWRMLPQLDVDLLQKQHVLLLGAGTLGCQVARTLLAWGIRKFTIVDYGDVSYSNPVRQSLFTLQDCRGGAGNKGKSKAMAAAEALSTIAADVDAKGIVLSIPMPGHSESKTSLADTVQQLDKCVQEADVVFLLTDTRESRWLPTVMAKAHDKMLINAALGLDSWLVMRHGGGNPEKATLGCYFCNDVVAPENSMKNRTLDQQCTVTRPGLAPIASSMAVELYVALLHHELRHYAPAPSSGIASFSPVVQNDDSAADTSTPSSSPLGVMPHQIRGSLVTFTIMIPTVPSFYCCTGCSPKVTDAYMIDKVELVQQVCNSTTNEYLENLSGLTDFRAEAASKFQALESDTANATELDEEDDDWALDG